MPDPDLLSPALPACRVTSRPLAEVVSGGSSTLVVALTRSSGWDSEPIRRLVGDAGVSPDLSDAVTATMRPSAKAGSTCLVPLAGALPGLRALVLLGAGDGGSDDLRTAGAGLTRSAAAHGQLVVTVPGPPTSSAGLSALVEGLALGGYRSPRWGSERSEQPDEASARPAPDLQVTVLGSDDEATVTRALCAARATALARNLATTPPNVKSPGWLADQAVTVAGSKGLSVTVWDEKDLAREGFGGLLAVGGASATPPRLVRLSYRPDEVAGAGAPPHVVLVGKGITFDSGGLDLKPPEALLSMKTDMTGAAVVLAVLAACRECAVPVRVTGLLAIAENAVGASAYRPGDVVTQYGGRTVEIANTDAEGRIVLADALAYADAKLQPDILLDIATLTAAAAVALGRSVAPVYATDDLLADALVAAGARSGERLWRLPLVEDYREQLDSDVADVNHIGGLGARGGSILAALFLREFTGRRRWAHLDIAGPGRAERDDGHVSKGATGFGARLLLDWLERLG